MRRISYLLFVIIISLSAACTSIPNEAPVLSAQLGTRLSKLELAHTDIASKYFSEKKEQVNSFLVDKWLPTFIAEFFKDPTIQTYRNEVLQSNNPALELQFFQTISTNLQQKINQKRSELFYPIEQKEKAFFLQLRNQYSLARHANQTITDLLSSIISLEQQKKQYLDLMKVDPTKLDTLVEEIDRNLSDIKK